MVNKITRTQPYELYEDNTTQHNTRQDRTGQDKTRQDRTGQDSISQCIIASALLPEHELLLEPFKLP